ncbi:GH20129 [Drosophila grimshawi]|uniref:GH20129 n=1 Tax=Drosophila grimshawi TaxID=7222 RepID=B4J6U2_DROGR|nr:GH20129 [Drosophila grimshawi]
MALIVLTVLLVVVVLLYKLSMCPYKIFKERGIVHEPPRPFIGNVKIGVLLGRTPLLKMLIDEYCVFRHHKIHGFYNMREPFFVLHDVELIKRVGIQHFDNFTNHRSLMAIDYIDSIFAKGLTALKDDKWRKMRNTLTPCFTGSKLKAMFELINECSVEGVRYIECELRGANTNEIELEMKDYFGRFANDVIASSAFGLKVNSFAHQKNQFYTLGQSVLHISRLAMFKVFLYGIIPNVMKCLRVKVFDSRKVNYFINLVFDAMKYRAEHKIIRPDMIHLLMEAKRQFQQHRQNEIPPKSGEEQAEFNDEDLLAQCLLFFMVGFDVISTCLCFLTYELCMNQEVQSKLYDEISSVEEELQGKPLNYNMLAKMKYMDSVISESLRLWPPAFTLDRECGKDIDMFDENNELIVKFKKGDIINIPIIALHRDPHYFKDPELFSPERFSDENKGNIKPFTYLPFGLGPRGCIGNRMALMEVKSIIYHLVSKFKLVPAKKTVKNMMQSLNGFHMQPKEKFWIRFVTREGA